MDVGSSFLHLQKLNSIVCICVSCILPVYFSSSSELNRMTLKPLGVSIYWWKIHQPTIIFEECPVCHSHRNWGFKCSQYISTISLTFKLFPLKKNSYSCRYCRFSSIIWASPEIRFFLKHSYKYYHIFTTSTSFQCPNWIQPVSSLFVQF